MSDRKYRQHGYQDSGGKAGEKQSRDQPGKKETFGPRALQMPGTHTVSRCAQCGTLLGSISEPMENVRSADSNCTLAGNARISTLRGGLSVRSRSHRRIPRKDERNECTFYSVSVRMEKETSTPGAARPMDARTAFENLFKK